MIVIVASEAIDFILPILEYVYRHTKIYCAITLQITGSKKQSEERAALFTVRVHLPC
jgi:hypothetical protein